MDNPYLSSTSDPNALSSPGSLTPRILQILGETKPWVRLCSIIGFIFTGLILLGALVMLIAGGAIFAGNFGEGPAAIGAAMPVVMSLIYVGMAALYFFPSLKLWKYGTYILKLMNSQSMDDLEAALDAQRGFWKFVGIMIIIVIAIHALLILGMLLISVFAATTVSP